MSYVKWNFFINRLKKSSHFFFPFLLGVLAFIIVAGGGEIVWPTNIKWLIGDNADALVAWQFFRYTPLFQNPLGANYSYGMGLSESIIYADPLFILAFPFKLFSRILPEKFQYEGLWMLLCFTLQALFSWQLLKKITNNQKLLLMGTLFFILSPVFLFRVQASEVSFLGQWLILAGMLLYLSIGFRPYGWCILLVVSSLIHPYFLLMLLAIWVADLINRIVFFKLTIVNVIKTAFLTLLIVLVVAWQAGYFMLQSGYVGPGLGLYRTNLLSFINPFYPNWSYSLPLSPHTAGDYEGFSYLGLGMIFLSLLGLTGLLGLTEQQQNKLIAINIKKMIPLIVVVLLLVLFALSNRIVIGQYEWIQYELPAFCGVFRATGRMALPFYYLIYLGTFYLVVCCYKLKTAIILVLMCLVFQLTDSAQIFNKLWHFYNSRSYHAKLESPLWAQVAKKYKKIILFLPESHPEDWETLARYAAFNKLSINSGYFARVNFKKLKKYKALLINKILQGQLDKDSFYLIKDEKLRQLIVSIKMNLPYKVLKIDGYYLLLPNWYENSTEAEQWNWAGSRDHHYSLGTRIFFQESGGNFENYVIFSTGLSFAEESGTWTDGNNSMVFLNVSQKPDSDLILTLEGMPYINAKHPRLDVEVVVNQHSLGNLNYKIENPSTIKKIIIPESIINKNNFLRLQLKFKNAISPKKLNLSLDNRQLGLFISSLMIAKKQ